MPWWNACTGRRGAWLLLLVASVLALPRGAQAWTIDEAVRQALKRAPELQASRALEAEAAGRVEQARASAWPMASAEVGYLPHWPKNEIRLPSMTGASAPEVDDIHRFHATLKLSYRPFDLSRGARVDAAAAAVDQAAADEQQTSAQLAYQVRAVFLSALHARDVEAIASESLRQARREEKRAELRLKAGVGTQVGLAQARVRRADLEAQLARARVGLRKQRELLASLLGTRELPLVEGDLRHEGGNDVLASGATPRVGPPDSAVSNNPALRGLKAGSQAAQLVARSAMLGWVPTLALFASGGWQYPRALRLELGPYVEGGAVLSWDFFDGFMRGGRAREARAKAERLEQQRRALHDQLERRLIDVRARQREARANLAAAETSLQENEVYLRVARAAVQAGTGTELDEHQAELNLDRARIAVQQALLDAALVKAERWLVLGVTWSTANGGHK